MVEKVFPTDTLFGVDFEHGLNKFLTHGWDSLNGIGEINLLFLNYL
jgi:hypothetical protein